MRNIIFTRGLPGSGKSTFLREKGLDSYALSSDNLRLIYQSPVLDVDGDLTISNYFDRKVWAEIETIVEQKMIRGEFIILDATNLKIKDLRKYKKNIEKYKYSAWILDFSDISLKEAKSRNLQRPEFKQVPESVIEKMFKTLNENLKVPRWLRIIKPEDFDNWLNLEPLDFSQYKKIHHIGDLQGCYSVLEEYFNQNPINDDELYIFTGDYIDRGIENDKTINFLIEKSDETNFIFLEGNHDKYLWEWANGLEVRTNEFNKNTKLQLENAEIKKSEVRKVCRKLRSFCHYTFLGKEVFVSHGASVKSLKSQN